MISRVFRDMLSLSISGGQTSDPIQLSDEVDEAETGITDLLDVLTRHRYPSHTTDNYRRTCILIRLLYKYDCAQAITSLTQSIRLFAIEQPAQIDAYHAFMMCMKLDDPKGCQQAIKASLNLKWDVETDRCGDEGGATLLEALEGGHVFDISTWSLETMEECTNKYVCPLGRAWRWSDREYDKQKALEIVADEFYDLMTE